MAQTRTNESPLIVNLTVDDLRQLITEIVRQVLREESQHTYDLNADGFKVLRDAEDLDPDYARELQEDYAAIAGGQAELISGATVEKELRELGVEL
jgi:hypothetical protein